MKKTIIFTFLIFSWICSIHSQTFTSKIYDIDNDFESGWKIFEKNGKLYVLGAKICFNNTIDCSSWLSIDNSGNLTNAIVLDSLDTRYFDNLYVDDYVYCALFHNTTLPNHEVDLIRWNLDGTFSKQVSFNYFGKPLIPFGLTRGYSNQLIMSIKADNITPEKDTCLFMLLDSNMNVLKTITKSESFASITGSILQPSIEGTYIYAQQPAYLDDVYGYVTKIDSNGTQIWKRELPKTYAPYSNLVTDTTGNSYIIWQKDYWASWDTFEYPPVLIKIDKNGEKIWEYSFYSKLGLYLNSIFIAKNGDIIGCGVDDDMIDNTPSYGNSGGWIFRMSAEGVLKWRRSIADPNIPNINAERLINGAELPNGDLVFCGDVGYLQPPFSTGASDIWVIRTDSMGCLNPNCGDIQLVTSTNEIEDEQGQIVLFPNPSNDFVTISSDSDNLQFEKIEIFDVTGKYLYTKVLSGNNKKINISSLSNGFYVVQVHLNDNKVIAKKLIKI
jgi:Secretion system C-terminal sorting domain